MTGFLKWITRVYEKKSVFYVKTIPNFLSIKKIKLDNTIKNKIFAS